MAASTTSFPIAAVAPIASTTSVRPGRRKLDAESGRAVEILGHAIEYLTDEFVEEEGPISAHHPRVQAVQLLMAMNRQIYMGCPLVPSLSDRFRNFFQRCFA